MLTTIALTLDLNPELLTFNQLFWLLWNVPHKAVSSYKSSGLPPSSSPHFCRCLREMKKGARDKLTHCCPFENTCVKSKRLFHKTVLWNGCKVALYHQQSPLGKNNSFLVFNLVTVWSHKQYCITPSHQFTFLHIYCFDPVLPRFVTQWVCWG